jgi:thiamine biosynthesis lipoprotein
MITRRTMLFGFVAMGASTLACNSPPVTVSRPGTAFGTTVNITVTARDEAAANRAIDAAYDEIRAVHRAASLFDQASEVSTLNARGVLEKPSARLADIVAISDHLHGLTAAAFDPSIQPLWTLWSQGKADPQTIAETLRHVGWQKLHVEDNQLRLDSGAALSFNGIAQGYATDRVMRALRANNVLSATINTGEAGQFNTAAPLLIKHPRKDTALGTITLETGFVAISGDYASSFTSDFSAHHIFDPHLGVSPRELSTVAVIAPTGAMADGLATAFVVMGVAKSLQCLDQLEGYAALFADKAGTLTLSKGMTSIFKTLAV